MGDINNIQEKLTDDEISLLETTFYPPALAECLFSDFNNMSDFDEKKFKTVRYYQYPMLSWEAFYDFENSGLDEQQKFDLRKGASDCYCIGGRTTGKTAVFQIVDLLLRIFYSLFYGGEEVGFSAYVFNRITKVLDKITTGVKRHPLFKELLKCTTARSAPYTISSPVTGFKIFGINMSVKSKTPGDSFFGEHLKVLFIEETSLETEAVYKARQHSISEEGCVFRQSGMTNFRKTSPIGQIIKKPENRNKIINLPQKVNPTYTEAMDKNFINELGGKSAEGYRIFCDGDIIEDRASVFDMEFIRDNLVDEDIPIKHYEIDNDNHPMHATILNTIKRPNNANRIFIGSDVGRGIGSTEIVIFSEINTETLPVYKYLYNITLSGLFDDELQKDIFKYLMESLNAEMLSIDIGEGSGASIYNTLIKIYPKNVYGYYGNAKIPTGHKVDENGDTLLEDNEPVPTEEFAAEFSVKRLQQLFYKCRMILPFDPKFDKQFDQVMSLYNANRVVYTCMSKNDHLFDAFRVFAIAQWIWEFKNLERPEKKELLTDFV